MTNFLAIQPALGITPFSARGRGGRDRYNDIYGIYAWDDSKQIRFISGLAIDDKPLTNAAGVCHLRHLPHAAASRHGVMTSMESMDLKEAKNASMPTRYS
jgi:hypothetical protein